LVGLAPRIEAAAVLEGSYWEAVDLVDRQEEVLMVVYRLPVSAGSEAAQAAGAYSVDPETARVPMEGYLGSGDFESG
jgi:hypothetical protein